MADVMAEKFLVTRNLETAARVSPCGKWVAYQSDEGVSEQYEIYVRSIDGGRHHSISQNGGTEPVWGWDPEPLTLFYREGDKMMKVEFETEPKLAPGVAIPLFEKRFDTGRISAGYDVAPDGRFLMMKRVDEPTHLMVVFDCFEKLRQRDTAGKQ